MIYMEYILINVLFFHLWGEEAIWLEKNALEHPYSALRNQM